MKESLSPNLVDCTDTFTSIQSREYAKYKVPMCLILSDMDTLLKHSELDAQNL